MITIDDGEKKYCMIIVDNEDNQGHRTTLSLPHEDGLELRAQLNAYYTDQPVERDTLKNMAINMLIELAATAANKQQANILRELLTQAGGGGAEHGTINGARSESSTDGDTQRT